MFQPIKSLTFSAYPQHRIQSSHDTSTTPVFMSKVCKGIFETQTPDKDSLATNSSPFSLKITSLTSPSLCQGLFSWLFCELAHGVWACSKEQLSPRSVQTCRNGLHIQRQRKDREGGSQDREAQCWAAVLEAPPLIWGFGWDLQLLLFDIQ